MANRVQICCSVDPAVRKLLLGMSKATSLPVSRLIELAVLAKYTPGETEQRAVAELNTVMALLSDDTYGVEFRTKQDCQSQC